MSASSTTARPQGGASSAPDGQPEGPSGLDDFSRVARAAAERIRSNSRLRRNLPGGGRLELDRALPFLFLYRHVPGYRDAGTAELATGFSAYLLAEGEERFEEGIASVVASVASAALEELGDFLLVEVWASRDDGDPVERGPGAVIVVDGELTEELDEGLDGALRAVRIESTPASQLGVPERLERVGRRSGPVAPPGLEPVELELPDGQTIHRVGLEVTPFFRDAGSGEPFPRVLQAFRKGLVNRIEEALFGFALERTSLDPPHPRALARRTVGRAARHVDRRLGEVAGSFDTLLQVTPVNTEEAWVAFRESGCSEAPSLRYRPLPFDPEHLKRRLFHVPIEKVEDPLLGFLFRETQEELDRQITLLRELGTPRFRHASVQLYGGVEPDLLGLARDILVRLPPPAEDGGREEYGDEDDHEGGYVDAEEFARAAKAEIDWYRRRHPGFEAGVEIRDDVTAGLMVTSGVLCIGRGLRLPRNRVEALINHEIGTHLVTWCNGTHQPIHQFRKGLAGYDPLQEGIAVLAEYLVGGLTPARLRVLAGRVVGVQSLLDGADLVETFRMLKGEHGVGDRTAFIISVRIHRGGGLTKDAAYLRGLRDLLAYLRSDSALDPLFVGKLGLAHTEIVQELVLRGVLRLPVVKPRYTSDLAAMERLGACRNMDVMDLVERVAARAS